MAGSEFRAEGDDLALVAQAPPPPETLEPLARHQRAIAARRELAELLRIIMAFVNKQE